MTIQLSDHFSYGKLLRYVMPSVGMMIFMSIYYIVDGYFVSNFIGTTSFVGMNLIIPAIVIPSTFAFMLSAGGAAIVGKTLGEQRREEANRYFSMIIYAVILSGLALSVLAYLALPHYLAWMGAEGELFSVAMLYGSISLLSLVPFMLQVMFQALWAVAEKPSYGLYMTILSGATNLIFDYLWIVKYDYGILGAASASALGQLLGGLIPLIYFYCPNYSLLRLVKTSFEIPVLLKASTNGLSEMMTTISASLLGILYNFQLMHFVGPMGVAAYGVILYANGIFDSIFFGYGMGVAPIISYHFGANNDKELKSLFKKSLVIIGIGGVALTLGGYLLSKEITGYFVSYDQELWDYTIKAFSIYLLSFLLVGFNTFASSFFTALNDGRVSATISTMRILLFQMGALWTMPLLLGVEGLWWAIVVAEVLAFIVSLYYWYTYRRVYHYGN